MENTQSVPNRSGADDSEAASIAHALEHIAAAAGSPVSAETARRAVGRCHGACANAVEAAAAASAELGLESRRLEASTEVRIQAPALALLEDGRWLAITAHRGRRFRVVFVGARGSSEGTLSRRDIEMLVGDRPWLHFEPLLPLETVSSHSRPGLEGHPWRRLRSFLALEKKQLVVIVVYAMVIGAMTLATPIAVQAVVNSVAFGSVLQPLVVLTFLLFGGLTFSGVLGVFEAYVVEVLQRRVFVRVADDFGRRLASVPARVHDKRYGPELVNRFFDVVTIQKSLSTLLLDGLSLALQTGVGMLLLGFYHPLLLAFDAVLLLLLLFVFVLGWGAVGTALDESSAKYRAVSWLEDMARAPGLFRGASSRDHAWNRADLLARDYLAARKSHFRVLLRQLSGGVVLQVVAVVSLLGVGGWLVMQRQLTLGQLVAAELIVTSMGAGFVKLGKNVEKLYDLNVGVLKISRVLDLPSERMGGERLASGGPLCIAARELNVTRGSATLLNDVALDVPSGARMSLEGPAGCGKSTLLEVLSGGRVAERGGVQHDGLDLRRADLGSVRDRVVVVGSPQFITGSVLDNLFLGGVPLPEPDVRRLLRLVHMEEAVDALAGGLDEPMTPSGAPFSERQQRRLALVRGLAQHPRALLVDRGLDGLGLVGAQREELLDEVFGKDAPWTLVVISDEEDVVARCTERVAIRDHGLEYIS